MNYAPEESRFAEVDGRYTTICSFCVHDWEELRKTHLPFVFGSKYEGGPNKKSVRKK
jgi:hypothetical protein